MVAEHSFKGDGFWTVVEEEVAPTLTFGVDLDPILGDPDEIWFGPQDLEQCFTWDGPDEWLCKETAEIEEGLEGAVTISCEEAIFPLPQKATGPPDGPPPELIIAPVNMKGPEESLLDGAPQCVTWHESQALAWAFEGHDPSREVHGYPLHLLDPYFKAPVEGEPDIAMLKAWTPAFDECACVQPDPLPSLGAATTNLDAYTKASVLLKGEQNMKLPSVWSKQYAAQSAPQNFLLPPLSNTCMSGIAPGEPAAPCLEVLKLPNWNETSLEEPGGVLLRCVHVGPKAVECAVIDACKSGGAPLDANANGMPASTEGTASIEIFGVAKKATTAEPEALELRAEGMAWHRHETPLPLLPGDSSGKPGSPLCEVPSIGTCRHGPEVPPSPP
jgi:hypothetical protein